MPSLIIFLALFCHSSLAATLQDSIPPTKKIFVLEVYGKSPGSGYLQGMTDTSLYMTVLQHPFGHPTFDKTFHYQSIDYIKMRPNGNVGKGALGGVFAGAAIGGIIGAATYKECNCIIDFGVGLNIAAGALLGVLPGLGIGIIIGSHKKKFIINGSQQNFDNMRTAFYKSLDKQN